MKFISQVTLMFLAMLSFADAFASTIIALQLAISFSQDSHPVVHASNLVNTTAATDLQTTGTRVPGLFLHSSASRSEGLFTPRDRSTTTPTHLSQVSPNFRSDKAWPRTSASLETPTMSDSFPLQSHGAANLSGTYSKAAESSSSPEVWSVSTMTGVSRISSTSSGPSQSPGGSIQAGVSHTTTLKHNVFLTNADLTACSRHPPRRRQYHATGGGITVSPIDRDMMMYPDKPFWVVLTHCLIVLTAPDSFIWRISVWFRTDNFGFNYLTVSDSSGSTFLTLMSESSHTGQDVLTYTNTVTLDMKLQFKTDFNFSLTFTAVPLSSRSTLVARYTSPWQGYIQPSTYPHTPHACNMDSWVHVTGPDDHVLLLMLQHTDVHFKGHISVRGQRNRSTSSPAHSEGTGSVSTSVGVPLSVSPTPALPDWKQDEFRVFETVRHDTNEFYVHFSTLKSYQCPYRERQIGFKMLFYFVEQSESPTKVSGGRWNCSSPRFEEYKDMFPCNLQHDCLGGQDELSCPYISSVCKEGSVLLGDFCYHIGHFGYRYSWLDLMWQCIDLEARLPVFTTGTHWLGLYKLLRHYNKELAKNLPLGLMSTGVTFPNMYRNLVQWLGGTIAYNFPFRANEEKVDLPACYYTDERHLHAFRPCTQRGVQPKGHVLCQSGGPSPTRSPARVTASTINVTQWKSSLNFIACPHNHFTHLAFACDVSSKCWPEWEAPLSPVPPSFTCSDGVQHVPYSVLCDHRADCSDLSDEDFCLFPPCIGAHLFHCGKGQCISLQQQCDEITHCLNGHDELGCKWRKWYTGKDLKVLPAPAVINFHQQGGYSMSPLGGGVSPNSSTPCPQTHFQCPSSLYCLPVYVRCNGVNDCPLHEDEDCAMYRCPGLFQCRNSKTCVHYDHLCDGFEQCPQHEDELLCGVECPLGCLCYGLSWFCNLSFSTNMSARLRFVEAKGTHMTVEDFNDSTMLIYLSLANCGISMVTEVRFANLRFLDMGENRLTHLNGTSSRFDLPNLRTLILAGNPLTQPLTDVSLLNVSSLTELDLSDTRMEEIDLDDSTELKKLKNLNLSHSGVRRVTAAGFRSLTQLQVLDLQGCPMHSFPPDIFRTLHSLQAVFADSYRLCCPSALPVDFNLPNCHAPVDVVSSCKALLRSNGYRVSLIGIALLTLLGNLGGFVYRLKLDKSSAKLGFSVFVSHLCVSDFLMGVYLAIIGVADGWYHESYVWNDVHWKHSATCKLAGFLSLVSCEVSAFIICLITLDRFLVLTFPFSRLHFQPRSAHVACLLVWSVGVCLATVPLLPVTTQWEFYSQTGICTTLPITRNISAANEYAFVVLIVLNCVLCLLIATGQVFIYHSVRTNAMSTTSTRRSTDHNIARRLMTVAMSDFLCWFPVGCAGILASQGVPISGEVNVILAILVLPLNSAINPSLYTLNVLLERRRLVKEERLRKYILDRQAQQTDLLTQSVQRPDN